MMRHKVTPPLLVVLRTYSLLSDACNCCKAASIQCCYSFHCMHSCGLQFSVTAHLQVLEINGNKVLMHTYIGLAAFLLLLSMLLNLHCAAMHHVCAERTVRYTAAVHMRYLQTVEQQGHCTRLSKMTNSHCTSMG